MLKIFFFDRLRLVVTQRRTLVSPLETLEMRLLQSREGSLVDNTHNGATDLPGVLLLVATLGKTTVQ